LDQQRNEFESQKSMLLQRAEETTEEALAELRREFNELSEQRVRELRETWEEELIKKLQAKDSACELLIEKKLAEHAISLEAERARGLKLEASKWRQALKDVEKRQALEVAQARVEGRDEREQVLGRKMMGWPLAVFITFVLLDLVCSQY
jgi:Fe2+ transport system protein B